MNSQLAVIVAVAGLGLLWLAIAAAVAVIAARRFALAQAVLDAAKVNARLLELMPARPLVVRADQRIEIDEQLLRDLGLEKRPIKLGDLVGNDSGITSEDLEALAIDISAAQACSGRVSRTVRVRCSRRTCPGWRPTGYASALVFRHQCGGGAARKPVSPSSANGRCAQFAHARHRSCAVPDVVPRSRPQARARQQRLCSRR